MTAIVWPWIALVLLGAVHGLNPGMGWLFAVALGMQEGGRRAVWRALGPLGAGHALAIAAVLIVAAALGVVVPPRPLRWIVAGALLVLGLMTIVRHRHLRWGGMRVSGRDLTIWSFLMATAHGAGLMALPFAMRAGAVGGVVMEHGAGGEHADHAAHAMQLAGAVSLGTPSGAALAATMLHAVGYLLVTGAIAVVVYERLGLRMLRKGWVNLDLMWAGALIVTGTITLFM
jgi:hypothetical protein